MNGDFVVTACYYLLILLVGQKYIAFLSKTVSLLFYVNREFAAT
jgi:hypothetical protein